MRPSISACHAGATKRGETRWTATCRAPWFECTTLADGFVEALFTGAERYAVHSSKLSWAQQNLSLPCTGCTCAAPRVATNCINNHVPHLKEAQVVCCAHGACQAGGAVLWAEACISHKKTVPNGFCVQCLMLMNTFACNGTCLCTVNIPLLAESVLTVLRDRDCPCAKLGTQSSVVLL